MDGGSEDPADPRRRRACSPSCAPTSTDPQPKPKGGQRWPISNPRIVPTPSSNVRRPRRLLARHRCGVPAPGRRRLNIVLQALPIDGKIVLRLPKDDEADQTTAGANRSKTTNPALDAGSRPHRERQTQEPPAFRRLFISLFRCRVVGQARRGTSLAASIVPYALFLRLWIRPGYRIHTPVTTTQRVNSLRYFNEFQDIDRADSGRDWGYVCCLFCFLSRALPR